MSFKRPYQPHQWGRQRSEDEVDLDRRLDANARAAAGQRLGRDDWVKAQYRAMSRSGAKSRAYFEGHFQPADVRIMDAHVDQMFWQMVRMELRKAGSKLQDWLEFIESFYEIPQEEFLIRIKNRYWAQMQVMTEDRNHWKFLQEVYRAWHGAKQQIYDDDPAHDARRRLQQQLQADAEQAAAMSHADRLADAWHDPSDLEMAQWLQELGE